ncbi:MAG: hypothetical protein CL751_04265 [Chloroflexi bacterium]|nr:hypothetical protein [Chloroflexota bacterium]
MKILLHHSEAADPELIALMMDYLSHIFDFSPIILILSIMMIIIIIPVIGIIIFNMFTKRN